MDCALLTAQPVSWVMLAHAASLPTMTALPEHVKGTPAGLVLPGMSLCGLRSRRSLWDWSHASSPKYYPNHCLFVCLLSVCLLPSAQVSEAELEAIARMGDAAALDVEMAAAGAGGAATRALLGEYTTPARWAATSLGLALGMVLEEEEGCG